MLASSRFRERNKKVLKPMKAAKKNATTIRLTPESGCFREVSDLLVVLQSIFMACEHLISGSVHFAPGDYLTLEAQNCQQTIRLPLFGPVQAALADRQADVIELTVVQGITQERAYAHTTRGFVRVTNRAVLPYLVMYHEGHIDQIEKLYPAGRTARSAAWQMLWAVRNAASHNGRVFKAGAKAPVTWRGLTHGPNDDEDHPLFTRMSEGDLLLLLLECEDERAGYAEAK